MKLIQIISKARDGQKAEAVFEMDTGLLRTKHIQKAARNWTYCDRMIYKKNGERKPVIKSLIIQSDI